MKPFALTLLVTLFSSICSLAQVDSIEEGDSPLRLSPELQIRAFQVDALKFFSFDLFVNLDVDILKYGDGFSFGLRPLYLDQGCLTFGSACDHSTNYSLLMYGSAYVGDTGGGPDFRFTAMAGAGSVRHRERDPLLENIYPVVGLEAQIRLLGWLTATADYFLIPGYQESMSGYIPIGIRIGYVRW
ncbi:MAG: hypothetical protein KDD67_16685 [Ignavibacteriae bacterium]|nr:hypothetical protein [Ignavibacteriota bacterium]MCB9217368.1 hypothetical protein [Ignavibacteria bacterium]